MKKIFVTSILCLWGLFFCYDITYAKPDGIFTKVQDWWNDGWHYVEEVNIYDPGYPGFNGVVWRCKLYTKTINGNITYMVKDHNKKEHTIYLNSSFGKRLTRNRNGEVIENEVYDRKYYVSGKGYFNIPGEDVSKELATFKTKEWQFVKMVNLYKTEERQGYIIRIFEQANLYWRQIDGKYMIIPRGPSNSIDGKYYNRIFQKEMFYEPINPREIIVEEKFHYISYQRDYYHNAPMITEGYTHKAAEFSLNL